MRSQNFLTVRAHCVKYTHYVKCYHLSNNSHDSMKSIKLKFFFIALLLSSFSIVHISQTYSSTHSSFFCSPRKQFQRWFTTVNSIDTHTLVTRQLFQKKQSVMMHVFKAIKNNKRKFVCNRRSF